MITSNKQTRFEVSKGSAGETRAVYLRVRSGTVESTKELVQGSVFADYDATGDLLGLEAIRRPTGEEIAAIRFGDRDYVQALADEHLWGGRVDMNGNVGDAHRREFNEAAAESIEANVRRVSERINNLNPCILRFSEVLPRRVFLHPSFTTVPYAMQTAESVRVIRPALDTEKGFGASLYDSEEYRSLEDSCYGVESEADLRFVKFDQLGPIEKMCLADEVIDELYRQFERYQRESVPRP